MTNEIITSVQRRRRWTAPEKVRMVEETFEPGMTVSLVARRHGVAPNQLFTWHRLVAQGSLTAAGSGEEVVIGKTFGKPICEHQAIQLKLGEMATDILVRFRSLSRNENESDESVVILWLALDSHSLTKPESRCAERVPSVGTTRVSTRSTGWRVV
jgi:transposase